MIRATPTSARLSYTSTDLEAILRTVAKVCDQWKPRA
jgi:hypothetical protein